MLKPLLCFKFLFLFIFCNENPQLAKNHQITLELNDLSLRKSFGILTNWELKDGMNFIFDLDRFKLTTISRNNDTKISDPNLIESCQLILTYFPKADNLIMKRKNELNRSNFLNYQDYFIYLHKDEGIESNLEVVNGHEKCLEILKYNNTQGIHNILKVVEKIWDVLDDYDKNQLKQNFAGISIPMNTYGFKRTDPKDIEKYFNNQINFHYKDVEALLEIKREEFKSEDIKRQFDNYLQFLKDFWFEMKNKLNVFCEPYHKFIFEQSNIYI